MTDTGSISDYFAGKHVFLTGGTGFIGKVLIEKLLRTCPTIAGIYCLVRAKKGRAPAERLSIIFQEKMFDGLRREDPDICKKVHAISGDMMSPALGMSEEDTTRLQQIINVVIHSAATIKFDEFIRVALEMNVLGVRKMIQFAKGISHLEVFLHVSTAYANCDRQDIDEVFYQPKVHPNKVADMLSWMDDETLEVLTDKIIGDKPNTYTYTKQLAEWVLQEEGANLPIAIVRPSIVTGSLAQPLPGWVDNWNGPSGLYIAVGKGVLRTMKGDQTATADIVPVDLLVNAMIAVTWCTAQAKPEQIPIYHVTTGGLNPLMWGSMEKMLVNALKKVPYEDAIGVPCLCLTKSKWMHTFNVYMYHWTPAFFFDLMLRTLGQKPRMTRLYEKLHKSMSVLDYFTSHSWNWSNNNLQSLGEALQPEDREIFYFDPKIIDWNQYVLNYALGVKTFVLKENVQDMSGASRRIQRLSFIKLFFKVASYVLLLRIVLATSETTRTWFADVLGYLRKWVAASA